MTLTIEQIEAIEKGCEGVTPGPYAVQHTDAANDMSDLDAIGIYQVDDLSSEDECPSAVLFVNDNWGEFEANADYFARLDPATVRALCAMARRGLETSAAYRAGLEAAATVAGEHLHSAEVNTRDPELLMQAAAAEDMANKIVRAIRQIPPRIYEGEDGA